MPDAVWPATLPEVLREGYSFSPDMPVVRSKMEQGPERVTRIADSFVTDVGASLQVTSEQLNTLMTFYDTGANAGADWFLMPVNIGTGSAQRRCRIKSRPRFSPSGYGYKVSLQLEVEGA